MATSYGDFIKMHRTRLGMTQRALADATGFTDGYIAHLESEVKLPSFAICAALANTFGLSDPEREVFLQAVEEARIARSNQRLRTRGVATRSLLRSGAEPRLPANEPTPEQIARDLTTDPDLRAAYRDLRKALADPDLRGAVLGALRAFAQKSAASRKDTSE